MIDNAAMTASDTSGLPQLSDNKVSYSWRQSLVTKMVTKEISDSCKEVVIKWLRGGCREMDYLKNEMKQE